MKPARFKRAFSFCLALALILLLALSGCGNSAQLKEGQKLMKQYLSGLGRGAALLDSHVDVQRPAADTLVASDFVKGSFRANGQTWDFAVDTATGEIYTSERLSEFTDCCVRQIAARLGLDSEYVADCLMELWRPAWQEEKSEWPRQRAYLGEVLPVGVTDMDAYAARASCARGAGAARRFRTGTPWRCSCSASLTPSRCRRPRPSRGTTTM